jgi:hypothetical protein
MIEELMGKWIVVFVKVPHQLKPYIFHGKLTKVSDREICIDDAKVGYLYFPRSEIINYREMNRFDFIQLAEKSEKWLVIFKLHQADERIKGRFDELSTKIKKALNG